MKINPAIKRGIAIFLLLVFVQQMGVGLFIHNLLHDKVAVGHSPIKKAESSPEINFGCNCVDNFLTPFIEAEETVVVKKGSTLFIPGDAYSEQVYYRSKFFSALRGPPVFIG